MYHHLFCSKLAYHPEFPILCTNRADLEELFEIPNARLLNEMQVHGHIHIEEPAWIFTIGADPFYFRCQMYHYGGLHLIVHTDDVGFFC